MGRQTASPDRPSFYPPNRAAVTLRASPYALPGPTSRTTTPVIAAAALTDPKIAPTIQRMRRVSNA